MDAARYTDIVARRRAFSWPGYRSYGDVGLDGDWVTPYHLSCKSLTGPVLLTYNFLDAPTALREHAALRRQGYLPEMAFNRVLDLALAQAGKARSDIYVTHAFHLLANSRSERIATAAVDASFDAIARHELLGRPVIALGQEAARQCRRHALPHLAVPHLSARGTAFAVRAAALAAALQITCQNA
ncbi:hypothetical protein [Devosia rhizoryzae]|uniref:RES domain-containing protein n=1 Tax=Devosia rhizoryzae TaxID=2774137 RepID=A0ABX7C6Z3_9HYPH|nr:hypothetical protein [Devosia rhizoryzae]QQR39983.1 hypothetical protein JI748_02905 [Devosia rhizoryzae]